MKYELLLRPQRQIRLLTINAAKNLEDPIISSLSNVSIDQDPAFWALSYVWGDPKVTQDISVGEQTLAVTVNLASALRHIRKAFGEVTIWIDAVCINQKDIPEKEIQLGLMTDIYSKAIRVIGWLGPADKTSRLALKILRGIAKARMDSIVKLCSEGRWDDVRDATMPNSTWDDHSWIEVVPQLHPKLWYQGRISSVASLIRRRDFRHVLWMLHPKFGVLSPAWNAIYKLFERDYWTRIWIVQEIILAKNFVLMCGPDMILKDTNECLSHMLGLLRSCELGNNPRMMDTSAFARFSSRSAWKAAHLSIELQNQPDVDRSLKSLVARFRSLAATNPRDRIYGLLGLATDTIMPKYKSSVEDVYIEFAKKWVTEDKDASFLIYVEMGAFEGSRRRTGLPSWVPDWEDATMERYKDNPYLHLVDGVDSQEVYDMCEASRWRPFSWRIDDCGTTLCAPGIRIGKIDSLEGTMNSINQKEFRQFFLANTKSGNSKYPDALSAAAAIFRLFVLDTDCFTKQRLDPETQTYAKLATAFIFDTIPKNLEEESEPEEEVAQDTLKWATDLSAEYLETAINGQAMITGLISLLNPGMTTGIGSMMRDSEDLQLELIHSVESTLWRIRSDSKRCNWMNRRRLFRLDSGYFGICPPNAEQGDVVAFLDGCNMTVVLRPKDGNYIFIGICFTQDCMHGQVSVQLEEGKLEEEEFHIE